MAAVVENASSSYRGGNEDECQGGEFLSGGWVLGKNRTVKERGKDSKERVKCF